MKYETIARFDEIDALRKQAELAESELARVTAELSATEIVAVQITHERDESRAENARLRGELEAERQLIAAAPELLEALRGLVAAVDRSVLNGCGPALDNARAAIAKALGDA